MATCLKERSNLRAGRVVIVISIHLWSIVVKQLAKCVYRLMFLDAVVMLLGLDSCGRCGRLLEFPKRNMHRTSGLKDSDFGVALGLWVKSQGSASIGTMRRRRKITGDATQKCLIS